MTILFSGDWHLCMRNLEAVKNTVEQVIDVLLKSKPPRSFVHLGDLFGDRGPANPVDQRVVNYTIEAVKRVRDYCDNFMFIRGNHDQIATPDDVPSCVPLLESLGVMTANTDWKLAALGPARIFMVPYFRDPDRQRKAFMDARWWKKLNKTRSVSILAFHNEVKGCQRNAHSKGEGLTLEDIGADEFDLCVAGHIHRPQFMKPNVHFVGSPFCADWGDANDAKRFLKVEI